MKRVSAIIAALVSALTFLAAPADAGSAPSAQPKAPAFMRVYGQTPPPYGFIQFCEIFPADCEPGATRDDKRIVATPAQLSEIDEINRHVNRTIQPTTDLELYGVVEWWTLPVDKGDCEDYALLKRHMLIDRGWPPSALLMTVVRDEKGEGHAILTVRIAQGDLVLDNKVDVIRSWDQSPYTYVMRQSYLNPRVWMSLDPKDAASPPAMAGVKSTR